MRNAFVDGKLTIEVIETDDSITITFIGMSYNRSPGKFITPILSDALSNSNRSMKNMILNFKELEFMNSSTIIPIAKILQKAKSGLNKVLVIYSKSVKWQNLGFSALKKFQTDDRRIEIRGV